ncbi:MAG: ABC transporter ATP-binding protein [Lysobacterales bacterium]
MIPAALEIVDLEKTYDNGVRALQGVSLTVAPGDFYALLGPNGAGKSTLIGAVCTLVRPSAGRIAVFGHDLVREREAALACIGVVPQEINFNQFETPFEIVVNQAGFYGIERTRAKLRAEQVLRQLSLWDKAHSISRTLSGGMKRRLMIARAMVHEPRLLILDEPTAGVDIEIRRAMWQYLGTINRAGTTVVLTTHYLEEAEQLCRHIAIVDRGRIIENTSMRALLAKLDRETFVLDLDTDCDAVPEVAGMRLTQTDTCTLEVEVPKGTALNGLFATLTAAGISVRSLRNKANRLEELFIGLVEKNGAAP